MLRHNPEQGGEFAALLAKTKVTKEVITEKGDEGLGDEGIVNEGIWPTVEGQGFLTRGNGSFVLAHGDKGFTRRTDRHSKGERSGHEGEKPINRPRPTRDALIQAVFEEYD